MGREARAARARRANLLAISPDAPLPPSTPKTAPESKHVTALRQAVRDITTLARFEEMVLLAGDPARFRALVEPMLPPDLACCDHTWDGPHEKRCPTVLHRPKGVIVTPEQDALSRLVSTRNGNVLGDDDGESSVLVGLDGRPLR